MITTNATEYVGNPFLPIKFAAIGLGVLNVIAAQFLPRGATARRARRSPQRGRGVALALGVVVALRETCWRSAALKIVGGTSLACWLTAVAAGRMIGYW